MLLSPMFLFPEFIGFVLGMMSSFMLKFPGGGITTFDFMVRMFQTSRGKSLTGSLMVSTFYSHEFRILSVLATSVSRYSSSSDFPCFERRDDSIAPADLNLPPPNATHVTCRRWVSNQSL